MIAGDLISEEIQRTLYKALEAEGIEYWYEGALCQMFQESHGQVYAENPNGLDKGLYQFRITSDDGTVLLLDGRRILELDGSHSPETGFCYVLLEKGFHRLELRYFEDCEGQLLSAWLTGPDGKETPLSLTI